MCNYDSYCNTCNRPCRGLWILSAILGALMFFTVGLILGSETLRLTAEALPAVIVLAVVLFIITAVSIITARCRCKCGS